MSNFADQQVQPTNQPYTCTFKQIPTDTLTTSVQRGCPEQADWAHMIHSTIDIHRRGLKTPRIYIESRESIIDELKMYKNSTYTPKRKKRKYKYSVLMPTLCVLQSTILINPKRTPIMTSHYVMSQ
jgi:hypothetical protein